MKISFNNTVHNDGLMGESGLYKIINTTNGHWYIGSTITSFAKRLMRHRGLLRKGRHNNPHLQNAYNKYGESKFIFMILKHSHNKSFIKDEQKIIDLHFGKTYCYNISKDASAPMTGRKHTPETILKMSAASKSRAKEIGECTRKRQLGSRHSLKSIRKMRRSAKNRDDSKRIAVLKSKEFREKMSKIVTGRKLTPEQLKNKIKRQNTPMYKKMMSRIKTGIRPSEDIKNKMSIARLGRQIILVHKDGTREQITSLRGFCDKYKIDRHQISKVVNKTRTSHLGWSLAK